MDFLDSHLPPVPISHRSWWVLQCPHRSDEFKSVYTGLTMCSNPKENVSCEIASTPPAVSSKFSLSWIVCEVGIRCPYSCWFPEFAQKQHGAYLCSSHRVFSKHFVKVQVVQPYNSPDIATAWRNFCFILSERLNFHIRNNLSIVVHAFYECMLISLLVDGILLPRYTKWSTNFEGLSLNVKMQQSCLKDMNFFIWVYIESDAYCCLFQTMH